MTETKISRTARGAGKKLLGFGLVTFIWLATAGYLVLHTKAAVTGSECLSPIACLAPNEWGDLLAGVFAPIAFIWLVATVWIQSDELRLQREELALTRVEMEHTREVLTQQAEESRKQAEFVGTQTDILKRGQIDEELRAYLSVFQQWVVHEFAVMQHEKTPYGLTWADQGYLTRDAPADPIAFFIEICSRLEKALEDKTSKTGANEWKKLLKNAGLAHSNIPAYLDKISSYQGRVSPSLELVLGTTAVGFLAKTLSGHL